MAFPGIILALCKVGVLCPSMQNLFIALVALGWVGYARIARGLVLSLKEQCFIDAARGLGGSGGYIIVSHVIPNIVPSLIILAAMHCGACHTCHRLPELPGAGSAAPHPGMGNHAERGEAVYIYPTACHFLSRRGRYGNGIRFQYTW